MTTDLGRKYDGLRARLANMGSVLVAFSGGVDSTLLAFASHAVLGDRTLAVLAVSDTHHSLEVEHGRRVARELGFNLLETETHELSDPRFVANGRDRCYHCKAEMFGLFRTIADAKGLRWVADGSNADDAGDHRPGRRAAEEYRVASPLLDVGLHKQEIRDIAHMLDLPNWDKPSMACLASRFPYGESITEDGLSRVAEVERALTELGLGQFRVRSHGDLARLEVDPGEMEFAFEQRERIARIARDAGFVFVSQDLDGFRSGSMNEAPEGEHCEADV
jgi:uncharacterized protein